MAVHTCPVMVLVREGRGADNNRFSEWYIDETSSGCDA